MGGGALQSFINPTHRDFPRFRPPNLQQHGLGGSHCENIQDVTSAYSITLHLVIVKERSVAVTRLGDPAGDFPQRAKHCCGLVSG